MFEIGDYIVCGSNGVCQVESIGKLDISGTSGEREYYTLIPVYAKASKVFTPANNEKIVMRSVISSQEAWKLIDSLHEVETLWIPDEKQRETVYKESLKLCKCKDWLKIIKMLHSRKKIRIIEGKKITASDEKYLRLAEDQLYGELALALKMDKEQVRDLIISKME